MLSTLLAPLGVVYGGVIKARNAYYDRSSAATHAAGVPVISVGNLTAGGTGKTPLTIEIVRRLRALGHRPSILTRGYAAERGGTADEVRELRLALPEVPVVVNADRVAGAVTACRDYSADCLVLDDGFQHRRLRRDFDVVLIDALDPWGGGRMLPAGRLREPPSSLRRADWIVIARTNQVEQLAVGRIVDILGDHANGVPVIKSGVVADRLIGPQSGLTQPQTLAGRRVLPVCGIGNPTSFVWLITNLVGRACPPLVFPDHHPYRPRDITRILTAARRRGAEQVVTTRKDWVKLSALWPSPSVPAGVPELLRLDTRLEFADPRGEFDARLQRLFEERT